MIFEHGDGVEASVDLGATDVTASLSRVQVAVGDMIVETVGGRDCRGNDILAADRYLYLNVDNAFAHQLVNGDVTIEVECYDSFYGSGAGTVLGLQYDSSSTVPTNLAYTNHPQPITTTGSDTWRTVRFEIADAFFGGRQNGGADFRLNFNGRKLNVNRVWVRLPDKSHFSTWIAGNFSGGATVPNDKRGPNDDPDGDGIRNLLEFAIAGEDPTRPNPSVGSLSGGTYTNNASTISHTLPGTNPKHFLRLRVIHP